MGQGVDGGIGLGGFYRFHHAFGVAARGRGDPRDEQGPLRERDEVGEGAADADAEARVAFPVVRPVEVRYTYGPGVADVNGGAVDLRDAGRGVSASGTRRAGIGRIETTGGPEDAPAGVRGALVRYMGTFVPASTWRPGTPAAKSASSDEKLHPIKNATKSSRHSPRPSVGSSAISRLR